jgi:sphinganine-1-phosphate aldolase
MNTVFSLAKRIPAVRRKIDAEQSKVLAQMEHSIFKHDSPDVQSFPVLPEQGMSAEKVLEFMKTLRDRELSGYITGRVSGGIYHGGEELSKLIGQAFEMFVLTNPLHSDLFPSVRKFEAEVVCLFVKHGGDE